MTQSGFRLFQSIGLIAIATILAFSARPTLAQSTSIWAVRNVPVDVSADNATVARERAIAQGQRAAFGRLMERLTLPEDKAALPKPSDAELGGLVQNFEVQEERLSRVRYVARLAFGFRPDAVRAYLTRSNIRFTDSLAKPTLILPVLRSGGETRLWEDPNPWREAWGNAQLGNRLTPLVVPLGDALDVGSVNAESAASGRIDALPGMLQRNGAESALVAVATEEGNSIKVALTFTGQQGNAQGETLTVAIGPEDKPEQKYGKAVDAVAQMLDANWKRQMLGGSTAAIPPPQVSSGTPPVSSQIQVEQQTPPAAGGGRMAVLFPISGLAEWTEARSRLSRLPNTVRMELKSLSRNAAEFDLVYGGDEQALRQQLAQLGLSANPAGERYELRLGAGAPPTPQ